jgi:F-type H+-transporting ATPase subunit epsilon
MAASLTLRVITPERIVLDDVVDSVVIPAADGLAGVLPRHAPMVAALASGDLKYVAAGREQHLFVSGGFAEVRDNTLRLITEASERPSDIDVERAGKAAERARERLRTNEIQGPEALDLLRAQSSLQRALMRLKVAGRG